MGTYSFEVGQINARDVTGKFGPAKAYDLIGVDGTKYSFGFKAPVTMGINVGSVVNAQGVADKYGIKIDPKTVRVGGTVDATADVPQAPAKAAYSGRAEKVFPLPTTHGDTAIIRQNALTNAVATVADYIATQPTEKWPTLDVWTDMVITTAYKFAEFSSGQREVKAMKKLQGIGMEADELNAAVEAHMGEAKDEAA